MPVKRMSRRASKGKTAGKRMSKRSSKISKKTVSKLSGGARRRVSKKTTKRKSKGKTMKSRSRRSQKGAGFDLTPNFFHLNDPNGIERRQLIAKNYYFAQFILDDKKSNGEKVEDKDIAYQKYLIFIGQVTEDFIKSSILNVTRLSHEYKKPQNEIDQMAKLIAHSINSRVPMKVPLPYPYFYNLGVNNTENEELGNTGFKHTTNKFLTMSYASTGTNYPRPVKG